MSDKGQDEESWSIPSLGPCTVPSTLPVLSFIQDAPSHTAPTFTTLEPAGPRPTLFFTGPSVTAGLVTCGGICPALNDVIRSIVNMLHYKYGVRNIIGFKYGFAGLNPETSVTMSLDPHVVRDIHQLGGTILGSSRGPQPVDKMVDCLVSHKVDMLFTIGGDGTLKGAQAIHEEVMRRGLKIAIVGLPKTIDNDIAHISKTFGFDTAVHMAQAPIMAAHEESRSALNGIGIVKLMGRESGFIALHASTASGDVNLLLLPEMEFNMDEIMTFLTKRFTQSAHCLIVVSEGAGQEMCTAGQNLGTDASGNPIFGDIGVFLKKEISKRLKGMGVEHTIKYIDPSYTIRSAPCVASDAIFAVQLGQHACHAAMSGKTGLIVGMVRNEFVHLPITNVVAFRKKVDIKGQEFQAFLDMSDMGLELVH